MKNKDLVIELITPLAMFACLTIGYDIGKRESKSEIAELKTELKQAKAQIKVLEENQVTIYHTDSWGGNYDN